MPHQRQPGDQPAILGQMRRQGGGEIIPAHLAFQIAAPLGKSVLCGWGKAQEGHGLGASVVVTFGANLIDVQLRQIVKAFIGSLPRHAVGMAIHLAKVPVEIRPCQKLEPLHHAVIKTAQTFADEPCKPGWLGGAEQRQVDGGHPHRAAHDAVKGVAFLPAPSGHEKPACRGLLALVQIGKQGQQLITMHQNAERVGGAYLPSFSAVASLVI